MFTQLRTRLLLSSLVTVALILGLVTLIIVERFDLSRREAQLFDLKDAVRQARELSLYVQYNAHDTNAYTLGHLEHRQEFVEHAAAFNAIADDLRQLLGVIDAEAAPLLTPLFAMRAEYDSASAALFAAADTNRTRPSPANQAAEDAAWERADALGDQLDQASQVLAQHIDEHISAIRGDLNTRNQQVLAGEIGLGATVIVLVLIIQLSAAGAIGGPLNRLLETVRRFAGGDLSARTGLRRQDEIGALASAFDDMATQIGRQTSDLQAQYAATTAAQQTAEAARVALAAQLATIEEQRLVIRDMSAPLLPLSDQALVLPLVGILDEARLQLVQDQALIALERSQARYVIIDVTGVPVLDSQVSQGLLNIVDAARLMGTEVLLVGIRPEVAQSLVGLGVSLDRIRTFSNLQQGIRAVLVIRPGAAV